MYYFTLFSGITSLITTQIRLFNLSSSNSINQTIYYIPTPKAYTIQKHNENANIKCEVYCMQIRNIDNKKKIRKKNQSINQ